jgi:hypothetical protein
MPEMLSSFALVSGLRGSCGLSVHAVLLYIRIRDRLLGSSRHPLSQVEGLTDGQVEFIKHLSSEIATQSEYLGTLRARMGLTFILGPFVVFGSFLIAAKGVQFPPKFWSDHLPLVFIASLSYLMLGLYDA